MKKVLISAMAAALAVTFAASANANTNKHRVSANVEASCKAQAAKKYSVIHFLKRRNYVNDCMAQHANAKHKAPINQAAKKENTQPMAAAPAAKPTTTGQAPKQ